LPAFCCSARDTGVSLLMYNDTRDWSRSQVSYNNNQLWFLRINLFSSKFCRLFLFIPRLISH
jgi:hypothetical protein